MGGVDGEEGVWVSWWVGWMIEIVIVVGICEVGKWVRDGGMCKGSDGERVEGVVGGEVLIEVGENKVWVRWGMGGEDDGVGGVKEVGDNFNVGKERWMWFVGVVCVELWGKKKEGVGNEREIVWMEWVDGVGLGDGWVE